MQLTEHALARQVQRGIPAEVVETIFDFGTRHHVPGKAARLMLDRTSIAMAADGNARKRAYLERYRDVYLIVGNESCVVTVARRNSRFFN